ALGWTPPGASHEPAPRAPTRGLGFRDGAAAVRRPAAALVHPAAWRPVRGIPPRDAPHAPLLPPTAPDRPAAAARLEHAPLDGAGRSPAPPGRCRPRAGRDPLAVRIRPCQGLVPDRARRAERRSGAPRDTVVLAAPGRARGAPGARGPPAGRCGHLPLAGGPGRRDRCVRPRPGRPPHV